MSERLHWLEAAGTLEPWRRVIAAEVAVAWEAAGRRVSLPEIDLLVERVPQGGIAHLGMGGLAFRASCFRLTLDPDNPNFPVALADGALQRLVVHELAHCLRYAAIGYNHNLGDAMVSEGLCGHFTHECLGTPPEAWEKALNPEQLAEWLPCARAAAAGAYDHDAWFYGRGRAAPPVWTGYTLGFLLVGQYLATHPGSSAAALLGMHGGRMLHAVWPQILADI